MENNRGFTLLEMLLVLFLISLIVGISAVVLTRSLPSQKVDSVAREIMATFRQARSDAIASGKWQILNFDLEEKSYGIEGGRPPRHIPAEVSLKIIDPFAGEVFTTGYRFVFSPSGVAEGGTIILSAGKKTVTLETDPVIGAVISRKRQ